MKTPIEVVNAAMQNARGDDLARARAAFRGLSESDMDKEHGQSGKTRQQILSEYEQYDKEWKAADKLLRAFIPGYPNA